MSETNVDLDDKRSQLDQQLASLRMAPDVADLVRKADNTIAEHRAAANALESQIAEIDAQLGLREMDRRAAAEQNKQTKWLALRQELVTQEESRLRAVADAERATRALVKAIDEILAANTRMSKIAQELSANGKVPMALNPMELVSRMSSRIASVVMTIKGHGFRFGAITWPSAANGLYPANGPAWKDDEGQRMARALIGPLLERGKA